MTDALTDTEKFSIMTRVFYDIYEGYEQFSDKVSASRSSVHNWETRRTKNINSKSKSELCDIFNLQATVWTDAFYDEINFEHSLHNYQKITPKHTNTKNTRIESKILGNPRELSPQESSYLNSFKESPSIDIGTIDTTKYSSGFLFELAKLLKNKKQIAAALSMVEEIVSSRTTFSYRHYQELQHLKAVLLSDDTYKQWDEAIHILRLLYASKYHLQEPEVITLTASNFKRKALASDHGWKRRTEIDINQLLNAFSLYKEAYHLKEISFKYYDAINIAYLSNIIDMIEPEYADIEPTKALYEKLKSQWTPNNANWWEVSSNAEFLMLIGEAELAKSDISYFLDSHRVKPFEMESTLRQLEMYLHFVDDGNAKIFYDFLMQSWEALR